MSVERVIQGLTEMRSDLDRILNRTIELRGIRAAETVSDDMTYALANTLERVLGELEKGSLMAGGSPLFAAVREASVLLAAYKAQAGLTEGEENGDPD